MARVHHRKARKNYKDHGIKKGDMYYYVKIKTGPRSSRVIRSLKPPKRSQLTSSSYLSQLYDIEDNIAAMTEINEAADYAEQLRTLGEEQRDNLSNMPDSLQQSETGQMLEERADACDSAADEIESIVSEWESSADEEDDREDAPFIEQMQAISIG